MTLLCALHGIPAESPFVSRVSCLHCVSGALFRLVALLMGVHYNSNTNVWAFRLTTIAKKKTVSECLGV